MCHLEAPKISIRLDTRFRAICIHACSNKLLSRKNLLDAALQLFCKTGPVWAKNIRDKHFNACLAAHKKALSQNSTFKEKKLKNQLEAL